MMVTDPLDVIAQASVLQLIKVGHKVSVGHKAIVKGQPVGQLLILLIGHQHAKSSQNLPIVKSSIAYSQSHVSSCNSEITQS